MTKVVNDVIETMKIKAKENNMKIIFNAPENIKNVKGDENQIKQVIQNLIGNAIKYGEYGTNITLKLKNSDNIPPSKTMEI